MGQVLKFISCWGGQCPPQAPPLSYGPAMISELFLESEEAWCFGKDKGVSFLVVPPLEIESQLRAWIVVRQVDLLGLQTLDDPLLYFLRDTGIVYPPYREYLNVVRTPPRFVEIE